MKIISDEILQKLVTLLTEKSTLNLGLWASSVSGKILRTFYHFYVLEDHIQTRFRNQELVAFKFLRSKLMIVQPPSEREHHCDLLLLPGAQDKWSSIIFCDQILLSHHFCNQIFLLDHLLTKEFNIKY